MTIVSNTDVGIWRPGEEWTLEEELRIGTTEGDPDYQFGEIRGVSVDSRGRIYVLDGMAQHIKVYSPEGVFQQTVGASGDGPGELRGAVSLFIGPGDTLLVQDNRAFRINRYAPDGSSAGGFRMPIEERHPQAFKATTSGAIIEQFQSADAPGQQVGEDPTDAIVLVTTEGSIIDTLMTYPSMARRGVHIYAPVVAWDITEDLELVIGVSDEYWIEICSDGQPERAITKPFERNTVSDQERESIMRRIERGAREAGAPLSGGLGLGLTRTSPTPIRRSRAYRSAR